MDGTSKEGRESPALFFGALKPLREDPVIRAVYGTPGSGEVYLVGGVLRNILLGEALPQDYDFVLPGDVEGISRGFAGKTGGKAFLLDKKTRSFRVALKGGSLSVDFSPIKGSSIEEDLKARDFTVNAMGVRLTDIFESEAPPVLDPFGGVRDAQASLLRMTSREAFDEDPLRSLRAVRIAQRYGLTITEDTRGAIREKGRLLKTKNTSAERIRDELLLIFEAPGAASSIRGLYGLSLVETVLPEISGWRDVSGYPLLDHSLKTLEEAEKLLEWMTDEFPAWSERLERHFASKIGKASRRGVFRMAAFFHDAGKAEVHSVEEGVLKFIGHDFEGATIVKGLLTGLKFSKRLSSVVSNLVRNHHRVFTLASLEEPSPRAKAHLFRAASEDVGEREEAGVDLLLLALSDARATRGGEDMSLYGLVRDMLTFYYKVYKRKRPKPLLSGAEIMEIFGVPEGRMVGEIQKKVSEGVERGEVKNKRQAIAHIRKWLKERGDAH